MTNEAVLDKLKSQFGGNIFSSEEPFGLLTVSTNREHIIPILKSLREDEELSFTFLTDLCGVHYPYREEKFEVVYHLHSFINNVRHRIKVGIAGDHPKIPTATTVFSSANWME